ncbi:hypothetical protein E2P81_ATG11389 [Venturia nashicola]|nr:hypothetical protein E2P81_ATG11389 [Venturia nashicola]
MRPRKPHLPSSTRTRDPFATSTREPFPASVRIREPPPRSTRAEDFPPTSILLPQRLQLRPEIHFQSGEALRLLEIRDNAVVKQKNIATVTGIETTVAADNPLIEVRPRWAKYNPGYDWGPPPPPPTIYTLTITYGIHPSIGITFGPGFSPTATTETFSCNTTAHAHSPFGDQNPNPTILSFSYILYHYEPAPTPPPYYEPITITISASPTFVVICKHPS